MKHLVRHGYRLEREIRNRALERHKEGKMEKAEFGGGMTGLCVAGVRVDGAAKNGQKENVPVECLWSEYVEGGRRQKKIQSTSEFPVIEKRLLAMEEPPHVRASNQAVPSDDVSIEMTARQEI
jgi:hypothetical protein